jgi:hypothetical protein
MNPKLSDAKRQKIFRRAVATIRDPAIRDMVMTAPHKAFFGRPTDTVGFVWRPTGPVPCTDPPIAGPLLHVMLELLHLNSSAILIADDSETRDRAVALLSAALDQRQPAVLS